MAGARTTGAVVEAFLRPSLRPAGLPLPIVVEAVGDGLAIVPGGTEVYRNADTAYPFRQSSDFFFLTGFDEPDAIAVFNPAHAKERFVLFVRPRDREQEVWSGRRAGVEGAIATYGAETAYPVAQLEDRLREWMLERPTLYYRLGNPTHDPRVLRLVAELRAARSRGHATPVRIEDPGPILHEMRLRRSAAELAWQRRACAISREAHAEAMRVARSGMHEYEVQGALEYVFRAGGSRPEGPGPTTGPSSLARLPLLFRGPPSCGCVVIWPAWCSPCFSWVAGRAARRWPRCPAG